MLKKINMTLLSLAISTTSWGFSTGFYVGAGGGLDAPLFFQKSHVQTTVAPPIAAFNVINKVTLGGQGGIGEIFAGYEWFSCKWFYLAGELSSSFSATEHEQSNKEFIHGTFSKSTFSIKQSYGIGVLPGYIFRDRTAVLYGRLGYESGKFKISTTDTSLANANKWLDGFRFGVGLKKTFNNHLSARLDYSHINYSNYSQFTIDPLSFVTKNTRYSPSTNQVLLELVYDFC